jgi:hypothetical protein
MKQMISTGLVFFSLLSFYGVMAQTIKKDSIQLKDTVKVESAGKELSKSLVQLRDSINHTLEMIRKREAKNGSQSKDQLRKAYESLLLYRDRLENDITEVFHQTSSNGWSLSLIKRIKVSSGEVRHEYKRILKEVENQMASRS